MGIVCRDSGWGRSGFGERERILDSGLGKWELFFREAQQQKAGPVEAGRVGEDAGEGGSGLDGGHHTPSRRDSVTVIVAELAELGFDLDRVALDGRCANYFHVQPTGTVALAAM